MSALDPFTAKRLVHFVDDFRRRHGQLPTLPDFEQNRFSKEMVELAVKQKLIEKMYVNLTTGTIMKGFQVCRD